MKQLLLFLSLFLNLQVTLAQTSLPITPKAGDAWIVYSNDVQGELEPCGCRNNPAGGIYRKKVVMDLFEANSFVQLDAGDFLFDSVVIPPALRATAQLKAEFLIQAHNQLGHDAVVPGEKDFALGVNAFKKLAKKANFKFIAANLKGFTPYLLLSKKSKTKTFKIAILGLVDPTLSYPRELKPSQALTAAKKWLPLLSKKADIVVILSHLGLEQDTALLKSLKKDANLVDYIVGGHSQSFLQTPLIIGKTKILHSSFKNQYVGFQSLNNSDSHALIPLDPEYQPPTSSLLTLTEEWKTQTQALSEQESIKLKREQNTAVTSQQQISNFQTFPKCAECHIKQFDFWRKTKHAQALHSLIHVQQEKNKDCLSCHSLGLGQKGAFENPLEVATFKELETVDPKTDQIVQLKAQSLNAQEWEDFLKLMREKPTFSDQIKLKRAPGELTTVKGALNLVDVAWAPVQCENCHQAGQNHPFTGEYAKAVSESRCLSCHTPDRAPGWYLKTNSNSAPQVNPEILAQKRKLVTCPAGELE